MIGPAGPVAPVEPVGPAGPVAPAGPVFPRGISKLRTGLQQVPELVTLALLPGTPVSVAPTVTEGQQA